MPEILPTTRKLKGNVFAIQHKTHNLWSRGGSGSPGWGKCPKTWAKGPFKNHLLMYKQNACSFDVEGAKALIVASPAKPMYHYYYKADPRNFGKYKLLPNSFPYFDCEVLEVNPENMEIIGRYPAPEWVWENCFKPYYCSAKEDRYFLNIKIFCEEFGLEFD